MAGLNVNLPFQANSPGSEILLGDTQSNPATVALTATQIAGSALLSRKNIIIGGDFGVNPWQRGATSGDIASTLTYQADRWFAIGGASSAINISRQASTALAGTSKSLRFQRKAANADTAVVKLGQVVESGAAIALQGQTVVLSFYAASGANFSAAGGLLGLTMYSGTGADESAANMVAGSWAGSSSLALKTVSGGYGAQLASSGSNYVGGAQSLTYTTVTSVAISSTLTRYQVMAVVPATSTQLGVVFSFTPVGTAGAADYVDLQNVQLEVVSAQAPFATSFGFRNPADELDLCQRYFQAFAEPASGVAVATGVNAATNTQVVTVPLAVQMRVAPTVTVSAGTFKFSIVGVLTAATGFAAAATHTVNAVGIVGTTTGTAGQGITLTGGGGSGYIYASAEF